MCSAKTDTTTPGKLGRAVGFSTRASRAAVFRLYCNWFVSVFTLLSVSINLFYLSPGPRGGPALHHRVPPPQRAPSLVDLEQLEGAPGAVVLAPRPHLMQIILFPVLIILLPALTT